MAETMTSRERSVLEWLAERSSRAWTVERIADWLELTVPRAQGALSSLRRDGLVRYFPGEPGTWSVSRRGFAKVKFDQDSEAARLRMALEAIVLAAPAIGSEGVMLSIAQKALDGRPVQLQVAEVNH